MKPLDESLAAIGVLSLFALGLATMGDTATMAGLVFLLVALVLEWRDRRSTTDT
jgi:hypothetical protein